LIPLNEINVKAGICPDVEDNLHLSAEGYGILVKRFAEQILTFIKALK
jgi:lysophospholipase L1-like esterase